MRLPTHNVECSLTHYGPDYAYFDDTVVELVDGDWISAKEKEAAIGSRTAWVLQWYPVSSVGFNVVASHKLAPLLDYIESNSKTEDFA
jgi:hypothetical protein